VVIKILDIQQPKMLGFDAVKDKVKETYIRQHAEEKFTELRDQMADLTYEHPDSLELAAKTLNLPVQASDLFTKDLSNKDKNNKDISQYKKVRDIAFSNDVLNLQNNSDVIQLTPETVIVLRLKSHIASALLPLNGVSKQIEDKLKVQEADKRADKFAEDLVAKLRSGSDPQQLAASYKLKWNSTGLIGRYSNKIDTAILDLAFSLPHPNEHAKVTYGAARIPNGYAVVALKAVKPGVMNDKKQAAVYAEQIQNSDGLLEYELYKNSLINKAKVKVNLPQAS
jgi:peptidyl-prolyl cis-trans isomerase D